MQYEHFELQPIETCTHAWKRRSRCIGQLARERALVETEAAARDAHAAGAEPFAEMRDRAGTERDVDLRVELEEPLALRLGVAAADGDHRVRLPALAGDRVADVRGEPRVGLLADRAGVEDEHVRVVGESPPRRGRASSSMPLIRSESWAFIWHPNVVTWYLRTLLA